MANTYTQLFIQIVFAVKGRQTLIPKKHKDTIEKYMTSVIQNDGRKMLAISCMPDHTHIFTGLNPAIALADLVQDVKRASTNFINDKELVAKHFNWQKGFGAFSYSKRQVPKVINYIFTRKHIIQKNVQAGMPRFLKILWCGIRRKIPV